MISVDTPRCKVARPCCWLPSCHANVRALYRHNWRFLNRPSLLYAGRGGPSAPAVSPTTGHSPPVHQPALTTACAALEDAMSGTEARLTRLSVSFVLD